MAENKAPSLTPSAEDDRTCRVGRRKFLEGAARVLVAGGLAFGAAQSAMAQDKAAKADVSYQDSPNSGRQCSGCQFYNGDGTCQVVDGDISPNGWCSAWSAG